jgi:outer membrane protein OmpA-like peptidoglycan-associated protein/Tol biopolymer transport system component
MSFYKIYFLLVIVFTPVFVLSQNYTTQETTNKKTQKYLTDAIQSAGQNNADATEKSLKSAEASDPNCIDVYELEGEFYFSKDDYSKALPAFKKVLNLNPDYKSKSWYFIAKCYWDTNDYQNAELYAEKYIAAKDAFSDWKTDAEKLIRDEQFAQVAVKNPVPFNPQNLGDSINTSDDEYFPSLTADEQTLIFTRNVSSPNGDQHNEDFYLSNYNNGHWTKAKNLGPPVNTNLNEGAQSISADGRYLFFAGCDRRDGFGSCDIYFSQKVGDDWTIPRNVGEPINSPSWETQPCISADGNELFFVSNRAGGYGGYDIWISYRDSLGHWGRPLNAGPNINTPGDETTPFIHPDGKTLYFASTGWPGMGDADIFYSKLDSNNRWSKPVNLGYPINTKGDDNSFIVSLNGKHAYFSSDRIGKSLDLYVMDLYEGAKPEAVTFVKGHVYSENTNLPLVSIIQIIDLSNNKLYTQTTSDAINGFYLATLPAGKDYAMNVSAKGYLFHSENFSLKNNTPENPYLLDIHLQPIEVGKSVVLKNIFFNFDSYDLLPESQTELSKLIGFLNANPAIHILITGHTDNQGMESYNQTLSENRAKAVSGFLSAHGIEATRLSYKGYGSTKPIADNSTKEGQAENRRTEFEIVSK